MPTTHYLKNKTTESEAKKSASERCDFTQSMLEDWVETTTDLGDEDEDDIDSCSTFSLQQCIDEFRARRIRRTSAQREDQLQSQETAAKVSLADADLIHQNRSNKEHERKYKPCKNGFCYCFTSDSGDGGGGGGCVGAASVNTARGASQIRYARRSRKSESAQHPCGATQQPTLSDRVKERRSAPASLKSLAVETKAAGQEKISKGVQVATGVNRPLTAISRLETTTHDAPLIHIIQELRDNCVVSEVRVNKHKLLQKRIADKSSINASEQPKTITRGTSMVVEPTAPPMEKTSDVQHSNAECKTTSGESIPISRLEIKNKSPHRKPGAGRLLQKRLSHSSIQFKPRDMTEPPPKPPRASTGSRLESSNSSLTTATTSNTSPSIREAERIVDEFLIKKGVPIPKMKDDSKNVDNGLIRDHKKRMSSSRAPAEQQTQFPTCPSLSDIERVVDAKPRSSYGKNIKSKPKEQQVKDISFGWKESKVSEMLNYDTNGNRKEFKSQSAQAEPQSLGWQIPPKLQLDTVDGAERHNLAANLEKKDTPVKNQFGGNRKDHNTSRLYPKFGWRNLSPWTTITAHGTRMRKCPKGTSTFLKQSKKKILRLVTPKKDNKERNFQAPKNTPYRTVGIQTSLHDLGSYENSSTPQSPPGSYQTNLTPHLSSTASNTVPHTQSNNPSDSSQFDFTRKVNSPPKKTTRTSQRKLDFPSVCGATGMCFVQSDQSEKEIPKNGGLDTRTYRSYNTDLNQDATISKMGFILSNIRARLEASDEHAIRTFEEIELRETIEHGFDCPDSLGIRHRTSIDIHSHPERRGYIIHEPIYSEIEEDSIHVTESPQFDNKNGIESSCSLSGGVDLDALYAKVIKSPKKEARPIPLGQFLYDSLQRTHKIPAKKLPTLTEPSISYVSYTSPPVETSTQNSDYYLPTSSLTHCQSLNNIRVMEHNSPPNHMRNLSKSDLSLQRSEIFLENLCRSELIVEDGTLERLEKVDNLQSQRDGDYISYDVPEEDFGNEADTVGRKESLAFASNSTSPQKFLAKPFPNSDREREINESLLSNQYTSHCSSCPVTPQKFSKFSQQLSHSNSQPDCLNNTIATDTAANSSGFSRYKRLKQVLQNSLRKSKNFVKSRQTSLPSPPTAQPQPILEQFTPLCTEMSAQTEEGSCLNLDTLFEIDENVSLTEQIARAVSICRQLPELETTHEMVEAERLLLFTTLRHDSKRQLKYEDLAKNLTQDGLKRDFSINTMRFPVNFDANLNGFFNYYFTATFEIAGQIHSTQSTEFRHGEALFRHCNIRLNAKKFQNEPEPAIQCNVFMLRLRKINLQDTLTTSKQHKCDELKHTDSALRQESSIICNNLQQSADISPLSSTPVSSLSSLNGITSRFRRYASFTLDAQTFKPFVPYDDNTCESDMLCLRAANTGFADLKVCYQRGSSMEAAISIDANITAYFPKNQHNGFLHVQDPYNMHNWNRRWCNLNGLQLNVWTDESCMNETPLLRLNLHNSTQSIPLALCAPEICARTRSFCIECSIHKDDLDAEVAAVFFAAENETDLHQWLQHLNETLSFIATWMQ